MKRIVFLSKRKQVSFAEGNTSLKSKAKEILKKHSIKDKAKKLFAEYVKKQKEG